MASLTYDDFIFCEGTDYLPPWEQRLALDPKHTCCFTGHRPEKLPRGEAMERLRERTALYIRIVGEQGTDTFITGMARGFDLIAGELLLNDPTLNGIRLICAVPYKGHRSEMRTPEERALYDRLLEASAARVYFFEHYQKQCYHVRNSFMVNYSSRLIGYLGGEDSSRTGTAQTVGMAKRLGLETILIREKELH